jgi:hypothetical protein
VLAKLREDFHLCVFFLVDFNYFTYFYASQKTGESPLKSVLL